MAVLYGPPGASRVVWSGAYGVLNAQTGAPATVGSPFMLGSASKLATGMVVMRAVEAGALDLDAPVAPPFRLGGPPGVTLRHVATHTSGIVDADAVDQAYTPGDPAEPRDVFLASLLSPDVRRAGGSFAGTAPGAAFAYSNTGVALAASVAEAATGTPFEVLSRRGLFGPLGMDRTGWFLGDFADTTAIASPHDAGGRPMPHYGYPTWPDGQLRASVLDMAQILAVLMNEGRAGRGPGPPARDLREMLRPQAPGAPDGQGLFVQFKRGLAGHTGGDYGVLSIVFFDPKTRVGAVVLANQDGPRATAAAVEAVRQTLRNPRLAAALAGAPSPRREPRPLAARGEGRLEPSVAWGPPEPAGVSPPP